MLKVTGKVLVEALIKRTCPYRMPGIGGVEGILGNMGMVTQWWQ